MSQSGQEEEAWLSASEVLRELEAVKGPSSTEAIIRWVAAGLLRSRCRRRIIKDEDSGVGRNVDDQGAIPERLWSRAKGQNLLASDWSSGDFHFAERAADGGFIDHYAFAVEFNQSDLRKLNPKPKGTAPRKAGGRKPAAGWAAFAEELAVYFALEGFPAGDGSEGQEAIINELLQRVSDRDEEISRTTIQPVVQAVLKRVRSAGNTTAPVSGVNRQP